MDRKKFIGSSAFAFSALFVTNWGSRAEIRAFKDPQKPLLTEKNLTRVLSREGSRNNFTSQLDLAINEPELFLYSNFSLSPVQKKIVANFTEEDWRSVAEVLRTAKSASNQLKFTFNGVAGKDGCTNFTATSVGANGQLVRDISVVPVGIAAVNNGMSASSQSIESSDGNSGGTSNDIWSTSPNNLKGVTGRLNFKNLPRDAEWQLDIYLEPDNKFIKTFYHTGAADNIVLGPGNYTVKFSRSPLKSIPISKGHDTELKFGLLNVVSGGQWDLYQDKTYLLTKNNPGKVVLSPGTYRLKLGGTDYTVVIKDGKTEEY